MESDNICNNSSPPCPDQFYCDSVVSRCSACRVICDPGRDTISECCDNCPEKARQQNFTCPAPKELPPPPVSSAKPHHPNRKSSRGRQPSRQGNRYSQRTDSKKPNKKPKQRQVSSKAREKVMGTSSRFGHLGPTTVLPATSTLASDTTGPPQTTTKVTATVTVFPPVAAPLSGYNMVLVYSLLGFILAMVCLIGVGLLVLILYRNKRRSQDQKLEDQENYSQGNKEYLLQGPHLQMSQVHCVNLVAGGGYDGYDANGQPVVCTDDNLWNVKVHGQKDVEQYRADSVEGLRGKEYEGMLANCGKQTLSPGKDFNIINNV